MHGKTSPQENFPDSLMIVIIPDIHQRLSFPERILRDYPDAERYIFLGDYFDPYGPVDNVHIYDARSTCEWLNEKWQALGEKATWLIGNHDLSYLVAYRKGPAGLVEPYHVGRRSNETETAILRYLDPIFLPSLDLFAEAGGFVVSHAGFHPLHFQIDGSELECIHDLQAKWETDRVGFPRHPRHWIGQVGAIRGGVDPVGSPVWLDWDEEFMPLDTVRQIVGHTRGDTVRSCGFPDAPTAMDYCIDCGGRAFAILEADRLSFRSV